MRMPRGFTATLCLALASAAGASVAQARMPAAAMPQAVDLPATAAQGAMVVGHAPPGTVVEIDGRKLRLAADGRFVFGIGRDAKGPLAVRSAVPGQPARVQRIAISARDWPIERVNGVPAATVNPPPVIARRIARENGEIVAARRRDSDGMGFAQAFIWPVQGRISGRFGNQRVFNGTPKQPHSGMDVAAAKGTPIRSPADGVVTLVAPDYYLTGGTVMVDHGHGISSNFLHMSRIDVRAGDTVRQGDVLGAVGATGRATGPHLHWGMTWFDTRIDPLLVLEAGR